jgi:hypothetical protein
MWDIARLCCVAAMIKSPAYPPLDSLFDLACRDGVDIRPTLLRVLTDLYVQKSVHSAAEETQYVELALGLVNAVDAATRATVMARLKAYRAAPAAVLRQLESHAAAAPVEPAELPAPAEQDLTALFFSAGAEERRLILTNLDAADAGSIRPMTASAETIDDLETAVLTHDAAKFTRLLEHSLGIAPEIAARIVQDQSGEPIVVAAKALGMKAEVLHRILLLLNPVIGQSVARVYKLADLFDELTQNSATRMVSIWRKGAARSRAAHAPFYWDDEQHSARSYASSAPRRAARVRAEPSRARMPGR